MKFQVKNLYGIYFLEGLGAGSVTLPVISHTHLFAKETG